MTSIRFIALLLIGLACASSTLMGADEEYTLGFHKRSPLHWAKAIEAACVGFGKDNYRNPLDNETRMVPEDPPEFYNDSGDLVTKQMDFRSPKRKVWISASFAARGTITVDLYDTTGAIQASISTDQNPAIYFVPAGKPHLTKIRGRSQTTLPGRHQNAGGHVVLGTSEIVLRLVVRDNQPSPENWFNHKSLIDGGWATYEVEVSPAHLANDVTIRRITAFGIPNNPSGQSSVFVRDPAHANNDKRWRCNNLRWVQRGEPCGDPRGEDVMIEFMYQGKTSQQLIENGTGSVHGVYTDSDKAFLTDNNISVNGNTPSLQGQPTPVLSQYVSGNVLLGRHGTDPNNWEFKQFNLQVQLSAGYQVFLLQSSQYYQMTLNEEIFHARNQFQDQNHFHYPKPDLANAPNDIASQTRGLTPPNGFPTEQDALTALRTAVSNVGAFIDIQRAAHACAIEQEAKTAVNATHLNVMKCAYKNCP